MHSYYIEIYLNINKNKKAHLLKLKFTVKSYINK